MSKKKLSKETRKKQKFLVWFTIIITAINFLLAIGFVVYLYFWFKVH
jgi:flagellar basal body-associated protein FliL